MNRQFFMKSVSAILLGIFVFAGCAESVQAAGGGRRGANKAASQKRKLERKNGKQKLHWERYKKKRLRQLKSILRKRNRYGPNAIFTIKFRIYTRTRIPGGIRHTWRWKTVIAHGIDAAALVIFEFEQSTIRGRHNWKAFPSPAFRK